MNDFLLTPRTYRKTLEKFLNSPHLLPVTVNGQETLEVLNATMFLRNPLDRVISDAARRMNIGFAVAEFFSFVTGEDRISFFTNFIADYDRFSSDGLTLDGCYGSRIIAEDSNQINRVVEMLQEDPESRRAVISIYQKDDLWGAGGKNTPCTMTLQFLIRDGLLHTIVNMRSFDLIKGLTYDMFVFTMVQELIARRLGVELGTFSHNAGSMHIYKSDIPMIEAMGNSARWPLVMKPMPELSHEALIVWHSAVKTALALAPDDQTLVNYHESLRILHDALGHLPEVHDYLKQLTCLMITFAWRKKHQDIARMSYYELRDPILIHALRPFIRDLKVRR